VSKTVIGYECDSKALANRGGDRGMINESRFEQQ
jgi:hypothetical protein